MTTTAYTPSASQWAAAAMHLERQSEWRYFRIGSTRYVVLTSGCSGKTYQLRADARGCSCKWSMETGLPCSHRIALELAALEDELRETGSIRPVVARFEALYPTCRVQGCQDDPEPRSLDCYRHQLVDAF